MQRTVRAVAHATRDLYASTLRRVRRSVSPGLAALGATAALSCGVTDARAQFGAIDFATLEVRDFCYGNTVVFGDFRLRSDAIEGLDVFPDRGLRINQGQNPDLSVELMYEGATTAYSTFAFELEMINGEWVESPSEHLISRGSPDFNMGDFAVCFRPTDADGNQVWNASPYGLVELTWEMNDGAIGLKSADLIGDAAMNRSLRDGC